MATSTGKTIGLILLIVFILIIAFRLTPLMLAPLGIFPSLCHFDKGPDLNVIWIKPWNIFRVSVFSFLSLVLLIIWVLVIVWVYRDAERRGMNGVLWALLVFIGNLIGLLIYLIVRSDYRPSLEKPHSIQSCPSCQKPLDENFAFCPHCGARLQSVCSSCGKPVEKEWSVCPHCGEKLNK